MLPAKGSRVEPKRRDFLGIALGGTAAALAAAVVYPLGRFVEPTSRPASGPTTIGKIEDFAPGTARTVLVGDRPVLVIRTPDGELRAFSALCTHLQCIVGYYSSGAYVAKGIPWGQYRVNVEVPTFGHTEVWRFYLWRNARRVLDIGVPIGITHGLSEITIEGTVSGENGKRLRDATVTIVNVYDSEETEQVRTDSNGSYKITRIQPGQYVLYAYYPGYGPTASTLDLGNGTKTSLDFSIKPVKRKALMEP